MSINVKPLHDKVIVKLIEAETKTAGGIIIPDTAKQKPQEAIVAAVGAGKKTEDGKIIALDVKVGDRVYFAKWGGTEIKVDGEDYIILSESDILAVNLAAKS